VPEEDTGHRLYSVGQVDVMEAFVKEVAEQVLVVTTTAIGCKDWLYIKQKSTRVKW
jgi:hypothetical protein